MTNISYELAKELKEAGFGNNGGVCYDPTGITHPNTEWVCENKCGESFRADDSAVGIKCRKCGGNMKGNRLGYPTLSELIEACGDNFHSLYHNEDYEGKDVWIAEQYLGDRQWSMRGKEGVASTPTEAVARLWLALNKDKKEND